ncbi:hypothetical protein VNO80_33880 [Phaseolus coccineus]|uniref:Uncharacterized protein n=1 Tax=Phaseolus coccineus TaxID=3886 RepID=A0AAN9Q8T5_PHACN
MTNTLETTGPYGATPLRSEAIPARTNWVFALTSKDNIRMFFVELTGFSSDSGNRKVNRHPSAGVNPRMRCWKEAGMLPLFLKPTGSTGFTTRTGYRSRTEASAFETSTFGSAITPMLPKRTFIRCDVYRAINRRRYAGL